jgi:fructokinase
MANEDQFAGRIAVYGEALFDVFPDGKAVLGGAPFNVAWNLRAFGASPLLVTRLGDDELGERTRSRMREWGLDVSAVQIDDERPTGRVEVSVDQGSPRFEIPENQAFDAIDGRAALEAMGASGSDIVYHGSLVARSEAGSSALHELIAAAPARRFVDLNLRSPWWTRQQALDAMAGAFVVKINDDELRALAEAPLESEDELIAAARVARKDGAIARIIVTRGADGAFLVDDEDAVHRAAATQPERFVDSVGAGDAFSSVMLLSIARGWPAWVSLVRASRFAGEVCGIQGATTTDRSLYDAAQQDWNNP